MAQRRAQERDPVIFAFGDKLPRFSREQEAGASFDDRIMSIWQFLVKQIRVFARVRSHREMANIDESDILHEVWVALREKDHHWDPARGKYITFAGQVLGNVLSAVTEKNLPVHLPRNANGRVRDLEADPAAPDRERRLAHLHRKVVGSEAMEAVDLQAAGWHYHEPAADDQDARSARAAAAGVLRTLSPRQALALARQVEGAAR